jgi:hypothetical protein
VKRGAREQKQENRARAAKVGQGEGRNGAEGESKDRGKDEGEDGVVSKYLFE